MHNIFCIVVLQRPCQTGELIKNTRNSLKPVDNNTRSRIQVSSWRPWQRCWVVVWAGIELILFIAAHMVLYFVFVIKTVLMITHWCFSSSWTVSTQHQGHLCFSPCLTSGWAGDAQDAGRGHNQDKWPKSTEEVFHIIWCHAQQQNLGKRKRKGKEEFWMKMLRMMVPVFPSNCYAGWSPVFLRMGKHLPADGKEWKNSLFCFAYVCIFALPIKLSLSQPKSFHTFAFIILFPIPQRGSKWLCGAKLPNGS